MKKASTVFTVKATAVASADPANTTTLSQRDLDQKVKAALQAVAVDGVKFVVTKPRQA